MAQETGVHPGVAKGGCFAVDAHGPALQRADDVVGGILQGVQVASVVSAQLGGGGDVLRGDVSFGAMRGDAYDGDCGAVRVLEVVHAADAGQQQGRDLRLLHHPGNRLDPFQVGMRAEAVNAANPKMLVG